MQDAYNCRFLAFLFFLLEKKKEEKEFEAIGAEHNYKYEYNETYLQHPTPPLCTFGHRGNTSEWISKIIKTGQGEDDQQK